jgi:hypothetical protein
MKKTRQTDTSGYTLLFAVLTASLVLGVAAFILGIARKQYILSSTARDSLYSVYAADSGIECIAKDQSTLTVATGTNLLASCAGNTDYKIDYYGPPTSLDPNGLKLNDSNMEVWGASTTLGFYTEGASPALWGCATVTLDLVFDKTKNLALIYSVVRSRGYNLCEKVGDKYLPISSSRTVERALQITTK